MQSQLAAALLGQSNASVNSIAEDDEKDDAEEEGDDVDEFIDEDYDGESGTRISKTGTGTGTSGRTATLQMLLAADILQPGEGTMSIEYLGQRFIGDLLPDGRIKSQETDIVFASPSSWAIHCKRIINPDKKSGCGWASVKYKGRKLDAYKILWYKKRKQQQEDRIEEQLDNEMEPEMDDSKLMAAPPPVQRIVVKHNTIANRTFAHDSNTLVECVPFSNLGKIQPFLVSLSTNAVLVMDLHCHLTKTEVSGYLAGHWDVNGHNLSVTHAFPCRNTKADRDLAPQVEHEIAKAIEKEHLILVGWYHSHPTAPSAPTLRDIDAQLDYQIKMKGTSDSSYTPCIGVICSPYNIEHNSLESAIICYWVVPPPEMKPNEYGRPMLMSYSVVQDPILTPGAMEEMKRTCEYYRREKSFVSFGDKYVNNTTYLEKLKTTLSSKFPRDQNDSVLWGFIKEIICYVGEDKLDTSSLIVPSLSSKPQATGLCGLPTPTSLSSNLILTSNLANVLFQSGKFPSATSLLGLPDPMAQSTLAANNMFLSPSLFKMQDLLKPLSASSPVPSTSKLDFKHKHKAELKAPGLDFASDLNLLALKNKLDFGLPELGLPKPSFAPDLSISRAPKIDFSASDLSISSVKPGKTDTFTLESNLKSFLAQAEGPPPKISRADFSMLDLSVSSSKSCYTSTKSLPSVTNLSLHLPAAKDSDQPLNLAE